jgi:hypothetical protein
MLPMRAPSDWWKTNGVMMPASGSSDGGKFAIDGCGCAHAGFAQNSTHFRTLVRIDGRPGLRQPFTLGQSNVTVSPFVALGARTQRSLRLPVGPRGRGGARRQRCDSLPSRQLCSKRQERRKHARRARRNDARAGDGRRRRPEVTLGYRCPRSCRNSASIAARIFGTSS